MPNNSFVKLGDINLLRHIVGDDQTAQKAVIIIDRVTPPYCLCRHDDHYFVKAIERIYPKVKAGKKIVLLDICEKCKTKTNCQKGEKIL